MTLEFIVSVVVIVGVIGTAVVFAYKVATHR